MSLETHPEITGVYATPLVLDLTAATIDKEYRMGGTSLLAIKATGQVYIRFNELDNGLLDLNQCYNIFTPFYRFFLTWTAQPGAAMTLVIGNRNAFSAAGIAPSPSGISNAPQFATTVTIYDVAIVANDTEYSQVLLVNTKRFQLHIKDDSVAYRVAFTTGLVAGSTEPYINVLAAGYYSEDQILFNGTVYFASSAGAGKKMEIIAWS